MDITTVFKQKVGQIRQRNDIPTPSEEIIRPRPTVTPFVQEALGTLEMIRTLHKFVRENQADYVNPNRFMGSRSSKMSDETRDRIDKEFCLGTYSLSKMCKQLEEQIDQRPAAEGSGSIVAHQQQIVTYLRERMKSVSSRFEQMRSQRHRQANSQRMRRRGKPSIASVKQRMPLDSKQPNTTSTDEEFSIENRMIHAELENQTHGSSLVEQRMTEISHLLNVFSTEVVRQNEQIDSIHDDAVDTKENIDKGNEELLQAQKHMSGFRKFIVTFLMSMSFMILFLDYMS